MNFKELYVYLQKLLTEQSIEISILNDASETFESVNIYSKRPIAGSIISISICAKHNYQLRLARCANRDLQEDYEKRVIESKLTKTDKYKYMQPLIIETISYVTMLEEDANIIYVEANTPYEIIDLGNHHYQLNMCKTHPNKPTYVGISKHIYNTVTGETTRTYDAVEWLDQIASPIDLYKNPTNKQFWDQVSYKEPTDGHYWGKNLYIINLPMCLVKLNDTWVSTPVRWLEAKINTIHQVVQDEFHIWKDI